MDPVYAVCFYDSTRELRGAIEEAWQELEASFGDADAAPELRQLPFAAANLGIRIDVDRGLEISTGFFPVIDTQARDDLVEANSIVVFQLRDDGRGSVAAAALQHVLEWLLEDLLPAAQYIDWQSVQERFAGGERPLLLCDTSGQLLEIPSR
jgi:hypothetical protein